MLDTEPTIQYAAGAYPDRVSQRNPRHATAHDADSPCAIRVSLRRAVALRGGGE